MTYRSTRSALLYAVASAAAMIAVMPHAHAEDAWPDRPLKFVVGYQPGGGLDGIARLFAERVGKRLSQTVVVENRAGAAGMIGANYVAKSPADGYTVLIGSPAEMLVSEIAGQKQPYKSAQDFTPVALIADIPIGIVASKSLGVNSIAELIQYAKAHKNLTYGTPGPGGPGRYAGGTLAGMASINMTNIPYKGASQAMTDLLGNQLQIAILGLPVILPSAESGLVKLLAVTSKHRSRLAPNVPSMTETPGFEAYQFTNWVAAFVPKDTPPAVVAQLGQTFNAVAQTPDVREKVEKMGAEIMGGDAEAFSAFLNEERARYTHAAETYNIHFQ